MINRFWLDFRDTSLRTVAQAEEVISNFRTANSFDSQRSELQHYGKDLSHVHSVGVKAISVHAIKTAIMHFVSQVTLGPNINDSSCVASQHLLQGADFGDMMAIAIR
jgi:hypothetical protein